MPHFLWPGGVDARIVHTQHDEIVVEARDGMEDQVETIVAESMEEAFKQIIPVIPFVAEIRVVDSWKTIRSPGNRSNLEQIFRKLC